MRWIVFVVMLLALPAAAQDSQRTAKPGDDSSIRSAPTTDSYSQPAGDYNYDDPQANPQNQPPAPYCEPEQMEVQVGTENSSNGQHAFPVSFRNGSNLACRMGTVMMMRLGNSSTVQMRVRQGTKWVMKPVVRFRPLALESCQNCGSFYFSSSPGQDITVEPGGVVYEMVGFTSLNSSPCADADTLSWATYPNSLAQYIPVSLHVCAPLRFSGIVKSLPDGMSKP